MRNMRARRGARRGGLVLAGALLSFLPTLAAASPLPAKARVEDFVSPTRNISCEIDWSGPGRSSAVFCQSASPPQQAILDDDGTLVLGKGTGTFDPFPVPTGASVLAYGKELKVGGFTCSSTTEGMICWEGAGRGLKIARAGITVTGKGSTRTTVQLGPVGEIVTASRNISCEIGVVSSNELYCQTLAPPRSVTMRPSGRSWSVCNGPRCVGNPATDAQVVPVGTTVVAGPYACSSLTSGIACHRKDAAGFLITAAGVSTYPRPAVRTFRDPSP